MTDSYAIWRPEHVGHAPPNWRPFMPWNLEHKGPEKSIIDPDWSPNIEYSVPAEALNSPNDDAVKFVANVPSELSEFSDEQVVRFIQSWDDERKAKHGITLAPERDWATELWAETFEVFGKHHEAARVRNGALDEKTLAAIQLLRTRFEQMKGEGFCA